MFCFGLLNNSLNHINKLAREKFMMITWNYLENQTSRKLRMHFLKETYELLHGLSLPIINEN